MWPLDCAFQEKGLCTPMIRPNPCVWIIIYSDFSLSKAAQDLFGCETTSLGAVQGWMDTRTKRRKRWTIDFGATRELDRSLTRLRSKKNRLRCAFLGATRYCVVYYHSRIEVLRQEFRDLRSLARRATADLSLSRSTMVKMHQINYFGIGISVKYSS